MSKIIGYKTTKKGRTVPIFERVGEVNDLPSLTIPDMSIPLKELLVRYRRDGTQLLQGVYTDDPFFTGIDRMDTLERMDLARMNAQQITEMRAKLVEQKKKEGEEYFKQQVESELKKRMDEMNNPPAPPPPVKTTPPKE